MSNRFAYLIDKISTSNLKKRPFDFIYIDNFLSDNDLKFFLNNKAFNISGNSFEEVCSKLNQKGWKPHPHPGTFKDLDAYKIWRKNKLRSNQEISGDIKTNKLCEGSGMTFRLDCLNDLTSELRDLFLSQEFVNCIKDKFNLNEDFKIKSDCGFQKYLSGYEISPHPDVREKALTWMLNLNIDRNSENEKYHTHFMKFKSDKSYIYELWSNYPEIQRPWVPWSWCETEFIQSKNNSITIFSPNSYTLHAIKAFYNDLKGQRTQLYGNIWYDRQLSENMPFYLETNYENLDYENIVKKSFKNSRYKKTGEKLRYYLKNPFKILKKVKNS